MSKQLTSEQITGASAFRLYIFYLFFFSFESLLSLAVSEQTISVRTSQDVKIFLSPVKAMFFFSEKVR